MDSRAHEATYYGFIQFAEIGTAVVICHVLALAVGGIKHAWLTAIFGVILCSSRAVSAPWLLPSACAPAAVGVLLLLALVFY